MTDKEYEQKKRECWEEFRKEHPEISCKSLLRNFVDFIFDRAYALGREKEAITHEEIEKLAKEFAERECEIGQVDRDALYKGYYHGMKDALDKQEMDADTVISG